MCVETGGKVGRAEKVIGTGWQHKLQVSICIINSLTNVVNIFCRKTCFTDPLIRSNSTGI